MPLRGLALKTNGKAKASDATSADDTVVFSIMYSKPDTAVL